MESNLAQRREIVATTNTVGWTLILELANSCIAGMERKTIDEDDDVKGSILRREAKAARVFMSDFISAVHAHRQIDKEEAKAGGDEFITFGED